MTSYWDWLHGRIGDVSAPAPFELDKMDADAVVTPSLNARPGRPARGWFSGTIAGGGDALMCVLEAAGAPCMVERLRLADEQGPEAPAWALMYAPHPDGLTEQPHLDIGGLQTEGRVWGGVAAHGPFVHTLRNKVVYEFPFELYVPAGQAVWFVSKNNADAIAVELQWRELATS